MFIPYELALKLKEIGFNEISQFGQETSLYTKEGKHTFYANYGFMGSGLSGGYIYAPLWQQVFSWFEEKHDILSFVSYFDTGDKRIFFFMIITKDKETQYDNTNLHDGGYETYEEARLECLKKLIEIVENERKNNKL